MELTRKNFRRIILLSVIYLVVLIGIEFTFFYDYYESTEKFLHQGYITEEYENLFLYTSVVVILVFFMSVLLLYLFKPLGRPLYLISFVLIYLMLMFEGDVITHGLTIPFHEFYNFIEFFVLYLIYLTPLKNEFKIKNNSKQEE